MFKYFSTKNVENYKYEISTLKNEDLNKKQLDQIKKAESVIALGKILTYLDGV